MIKSSSLVDTQIVTLSSFTLASAVSIFRFDSILLPALFLFSIYLLVFLKNPFSLFSFLNILSFLESWWFFIVRGTVHGTWVCGRKLDHGVSVDLKEGDSFQLGSSSRVYLLQFVSQFDDVDALKVPFLFQFYIVLSHFTLFLLLIPSFHFFYCSYFTLFFQLFQLEFCYLLKVMIIFICVSFNCSIFLFFQFWV